MDRRVDMGPEAWCAAHENDPRVLGWLARNPPPPEWPASALEWAWDEMPDPDSLVGRLLLAVGF